MGAPYGTTLRSTIIQRIMAKRYRPIPALRSPSQHLADGQFVRTVFSADRCNVLEPGVFLLAYAGAGGAGGRISGAHIHHLPRLYARLVLQITARQRYRRHPCRIDHAHPVL